MEGPNAAVIRHHDVPKPVHIPRLTDAPVAQLGTPESPRTTHLEHTTYLEWFTAFHTGDTNTIARDHKQGYQIC